MLKRVFCLFLALTLCVGLLPAQALAEGEEDAAGTAELKTEGLEVEATSSLGRAFQNTMEEEGVDETTPYRINGVAVESGKVTVNYTSAEDAVVLVAIYEDRSDVLKLITTLRLDVSAEQDTVEGTLPEEAPEYFIVGAYLIRSGSHEPLCEEYTSTYYTQALQEFMSAPLTDFAEEAEDRLVILDRGTAADGSEADFLIFREGTVILQETETANHIAKNEDGSYTISGADVSALALQGGDKIGYKMLGDQLDVFLVESIVSVSGDTVVFTENPDVNMETFFETIRIDDMPDPETVEYDTSEMMPGFTVREENDLAKEVAPIYEAATRLEDGEALPESFGDIVVMGGPPGTSSTSVEANICLDINIGVQSMTDLYNSLTQAPDPNRFDVFKEKEFDWSGDVSAEGSFSVGSTLEMEFYLTGSYNYFSVSLSFTKILNLKIQGMLCGEFMIVKVKYPTPLLGVAVTGNLKLVLEFSAELSFVASWTSRLSFEYDSDRPEGYRWKNTSSGSDAKPKTSLALKGKLEFGIKVSVGIEFISEKLGSVKLSAKATVAAKADLESSILRRLNQGIHSWHDLVYDGQSASDPSLTSASEIHECDNCIDGTVNVKMGIGADFSMLFGVLSTSVDANLFTVNLGDFYYSFDTKDHGWGRCPHRRYRLSLTVIDGLDYTLGDVIANWYDQETVEAKNAAQHAIADASISIADKSGQYIQERDLITGADGKVSVFLPVGKYSIKGFNLEYYGEHDFDMYDSARDCYMVLEKMVGASHTDGNITWTFYPNGILSISGTGAIKDYSPENRPPWESEALYTNTIIIQNGITHIGAYSFQYFKHMTEVQLPASLESIGGYAFQNCSDLKQLTLPTSLTAIGENAFDCCDGLKKAVYNGSETQWDDQVTVDAGNEPLTDHLVFNSAILASGQCGESLFWSLGTTGTLTISGTGDMTEYAKTEDVPWHKYRAKIDTLLIEQGVSSLSAYAFYGCGIQDLALPGSVASIGQYCFANCENLINVYLHEGITRIPQYAFAACQDMKTISLPLSLRSIGMNAFYGCYSLKKAKYAGLLSEWNSQVKVGKGNANLLAALEPISPNWKSIGNCGSNVEAFTADLADGKHLLISGDGPVEYTRWSGISQEVVAVHFNGNVTKLCDNVFNGCSSIKKLIIPNSVMVIGKNPFVKCTSLESLALPFLGTSRDDHENYALARMFGVSFDNSYMHSYAANMDLSALKTVIVTDATCIPAYSFADYEFYFNGETYCTTFSSLSTIEVAGSSIDSVGDYAFYHREVLQEFIIPENVTSIGEYAFASCTKLLSAPIPECVTYIGRCAFLFCSSYRLEGDCLPPNVEVIESGAFSGCECIRDFDIPPSVTSLGSGAFGGTGITVLPSGLKTLPDGLFSGCDKLTSIQIPLCIEAIGNNAFAYCDNLKSVTLHEMIESIGDSAFIKCPKLEAISIPEGVKQIGAYAFYETGLVSAHIASSVTSIGEDAFANCYNLLTVELLDGLESIGDRAFGYCKSLETLTIPDSVTSMGANLVIGCMQLKKLSVPFVSIAGMSRLFGACTQVNFVLVTTEYPLEELTVSNMTDIPVRAFQNGFEGSGIYVRFPSLRSISITGNTERIGGNAFQDRYNLERVSLPASVLTIELGAFDPCRELQEITYEGTMEEWHNINIASGNNGLYGTPIHCSDGDLIMDPAQSVDVPGELQNAGEILEGGESEGNIPIDPVIEPAPTEEPDPVIEPAPTEEPGYIGLASFSGSERSETGSETIYTASFSGLMPGEEYLILAVRSEEESVLLDNDNILFVSQQEADENGSLSIRYIKKSNDPASLRCYGMSDKCFTESDKLSVVISRGATDSNAYALAVAYDGVELKENRDYLVSFAYLEDEVVQITLTGIVDYSGSAVILAKASCTEADTIDGYAVIHMAHEWSEPVWTWSEDQSRAEAVFTCTRDETHSITRSCEVSAVTENNVTTWTAAVSLGGKQYTEVRRLFHGDLNADEKVDALDLAVMRNLLIGLSQEGLERADVNGDGAVNILDLVRLRKHLAGQEVILH